MVLANIMNSILENWPTLCLSGGVLYLLVDKITDKYMLGRQDKNDIRKGEIDNAVSTATLYNEIDQIVAKKTKPLEEKIDRLTDLLNKYACYRQNCDIKIYKPEGK